MTTSQSTERRRPSRGTRRIGYAVAIAFQIALLILVNNLVAWDIAPFITDEFNDLVPYINVSLVASILVNAAYFLYDPRWFRSFTTAVLNVVSLVVLFQTYRIFPFDFSGSSFNWTALTRAILVVLMVLITIGTVGEIVKMVTAFAAEGTTRRHPPTAEV